MLFGWLVEKEWLIKHAKSLGYDSAGGVLDRMMIGYAVSNLSEQSGIKRMMVFQSRKDHEQSKIVLALYADTDCSYDFDAETFVPPKHGYEDENIRKLLKLMDKEGERPKWLQCNT